MALPPYNVHPKMRVDSDDGRVCKFNSLDSTIRFKTYSDARLAELYIDDDLPFAVLDRVLSVFFDPGFKMEDVTLKNGLKILHHVSEFRRRNALERAVAKRPSIVPLIVLDLVVDKFLDDRVPLGVVASEKEWRVAFANNASDFHNMSLVHRSWTTIAQRGLRNRAVVSCRNIEEFLSSPFCGPAVREMIIYWTFDDRFISVTDSGLRLFVELLKRNPNLRSLSFNTWLVWPKCFTTEPSFEIEYCLEAIAQWLPSLENLWLKHSNHNPMPGTCDRNGIYRASPLNVLPSCRGVSALCVHLPRMVSLKFLSITDWGGDGELDWNVHPPSQLKALELDRSAGMTEKSLTWLLNPREEYKLESLSISFDEYGLPEERSMKDYMSKLKRLVVYADNDSECRDLLNGCRELVDLELFVRGVDLMEELILPPRLEHLSVHLVDGSTKMYFPSTSTLSSFGESVVDLVEQNLPRLPLLRKLHITATDVPHLGPDPVRWGPRRLYLDTVVYFVDKYAEPAQDYLPDRLLELCKEYNVELGG